MNEHEYMMTEGWLWTGQYPEVFMQIICYSYCFLFLGKYLNNELFNENALSKNYKIYIFEELLLSEKCSVESWLDLSKGAKTTSEARVATAQLRSCELESEGRE